MTPLQIRIMTMTRTGGDILSKVLIDSEGYYVVDSEGYFILPLEPYTMLSRDGYYIKDANGNLLRTKPPVEGGAGA